jgi:hypothetical protein
MTTKSPPTPTPRPEQNDLRVPLSHELPDRLKLELVFDRYQPDFLVSLRQVGAWPAAQYSVTALLDVLTEALVGVILANDDLAIATGDPAYKRANACLTHVENRMYDGTFKAIDAELAAQHPDWPAAGTPIPAQPQQTRDLPRHDPAPKRPPRT